MKKIICAALIGISTLGGIAVPAAQAAVGISFNFGNVSDAYSDGYYDGGHRWHAWRAGEYDSYRRGHGGHVNNWRHNDRNHHHH